MKQTQPKDHPSFKRAIGLAHSRLMAARSVGAPLPAGAPDEMAIMAHQAYRDAVEMLERECSRRALIEYDMQGAIFIDEACHKLMGKADDLASLVARALSESRDAMPGQVRVRLDFGLREDGLIFGAASHQAIGGSFQSLQASVRSALERLLDAEGLHLESEEPGQAPMRSALLALIAQNLPSDEPGATRPLAAHIDDLRERLGRLGAVDLQADSESRHILTGEQASARIAQISSEADAERPNAAGVSVFLAKLGI